MNTIENIFFKLLITCGIFLNDSVVLIYIRKNLCLIFWFYLEFQPSNVCWNIVSYQVKIQIKKRTGFKRAV